MATRLKEVDAIMVGMGWTGSILARELTKAGLTVTGLERGEDLSPRENFGLPGIRDELRYSYRLELIQDPALETVTFRHRPSESALPMRRFGSFLPGNSVGGAANHWGGQHWRYLPSDHLTRSRIVGRYGANAIPDDMPIQDWAMTYDELEPYYDKFDKLCGVSGKAGNLRGERIEGGNIFEGPRSSEYPTPPLIMTESGLMFAKAAKDLGYHPFPQPASNASRPYVNSEGLTLGGCQYCGFCERNGCEANAKAGPQVCVLPVLRSEPKFSLRSRSWVSRLSYDKTAKKVTGVIFTDTRTGEEYEQPAGIVVLSAYVFGNISLLLNSGIGEPYDPVTQQGAVGKNYCYQLSRMGVTLFFEDKFFNPFMGSPGTQMVMDDFDGDNFDHSALGFLGGCKIQLGHADGRPISYRPVPPGTPRWGAKWKKETANWYQRAARITLSGSNYANRYNYIDLDPTYKDQLGRPLLRMTYNFVENDHKVADYCMRVALEIARAMKPTMMGPPALRQGDYDTVPYQSTHNTGGTIMGTDPKTSVVNRYLQAWAADNLFIMGASTFPQQPAYNPTGPVGALAYWSAEAIVTKYLKSPGPLVHA
ncbi:MAG TPA: GMC family oxidoreductase [Xanthobacteraceae bacterium]|nr:GMC family oxidoreductase [Xanthobacteraceae bacterium]